MKNIVAIIAVIISALFLVAGCLTPDDDPLNFNGVSTPSETLTTEELQEKLGRITTALPENQRNIAFMLALMGVPVDEIPEVTKMFNEGSLYVELQGEDEHIASLADDGGLLACGNNKVFIVTCEVGGTADDLDTVLLGVAFMSLADSPSNLVPSDSDEAVATYTFAVDRDGDSNLDIWPSLTITKGSTGEGRMVALVASDSKIPDYRVRVIEYENILAFIGSPDLFLPGGTHEGARYAPSSFYSVGLDTPDVSDETPPQTYDLYNPMGNLTQINADSEEMEAWYALNGKP